MKKKLVLTITAIVLVAAIVIGGTVAYLTAESGAKTNTFTIGNITLSITETPNAKSDPDLTENDIWQGKIVPGGSQGKDPTLIVGANSENCYVYALVDNTVVLDGDPVAVPNISDTNWVEVGTNGTKTLYRYYAVVPSATADTPLTVFSQVDYAEDIESTDVSSLNNTTIIVSGFAHQADSVAQADADAAACTWAGVTANP